MTPQSEPFFDEGETLIDEIRAVRHNISARFDHDPERLVAYYMEKQKLHADRLLQPQEGTDRSSKASAA
jgi:hypothetical protein